MASSYIFEVFGSVFDQSAAEIKAIASANRSRSLLGFSRLNRPDILQNDMAEGVGRFCNFCWMVQLI